MTPDVDDFKAALARLSDEQMIALAKEWLREWDKLVIEEREHVASEAVLAQSMLRSCFMLSLNEQGKRDIMQEVTEMVARKDSPP